MLNLILHGQANEFHPSMVGTYKIAGELINNESYFLQSNGLNAVWQDNTGVWCIGAKNYLGSITCGIRSSVSQSIYPQEIESWDVLSWDVFDTEEWRTTRTDVVFLISMYKIYIFKICL